MSTEEREPTIHELALMAQGNVLKARVARLEESRDKLIDALEELMGWQNGPPLSSQKWLAGWSGAVEKCNAALAFAREEDGP